jgi:hypothetical protein
MEHLGVDAWLEGEDISLLKNIVGPGNDARGLVTAMPQSVSCVMPETLFSQRMRIQKIFYTGVN